MLRTVVEINPKDIETTLRLARLMLLGGATDEALKLSNAASDLDGLNASALALRAAILFKLDDRLGAVRQAQTALEINPRSAEAMIVLAADRLARGDTAGALQILDRESVAHMKDLGIQLFKIKIFEQIRRPPTGRGSAAETDRALPGAIRVSKGTDQALR